MDVDLKRFNDLIVYSLTSKYLFTESLELLENGINLRDDKINTFELDFRLQNILLLLHNLIPLKVKMTSKNYGIYEFKDMNENLFSMEFKESNISKILRGISKKNEEFFFFNYFNRNTQVHHRHLSKSTGQSANKDGVTSLTLSIEINEYSRSFNYVKKLNRESTMKSLRLSIKDFGDYFEINYICNLKELFTLADDIIKGFIVNYRRMKVYVNSFDESSFNKMHYSSKERINEIIDFWINDLQECVVKNRME